MFIENASKPGFVSKVQNIANRPDSRSGRIPCFRANSRSTFAEACCMICSRSSLNASSQGGAGFVADEAVCVRDEPDTKKHHGCSLTTHGFLATGKWRSRKPKKN